MLIAVAACVALYAALVVGLFFGQRKILFRCEAAEIDPATIGLKAEILRLTTEDGESLLAWRIPPAAGRPVILYFHGNAGGLDLRVAGARSGAARADGRAAAETSSGAGDEAHRRGTRQRGLQKGPASERRRGVTARIQTRTCVWCTPESARQSLSLPRKDGGKSGLHRARCQVTPGRREPTESATERYRLSAAQAAPVRVKWCGKSAPRGWQHQRHGKPHLEQDQIGKRAA